MNAFVSTSKWIAASSFGLLAVGCLLTHSFLHSQEPKGAVTVTHIAKGEFEVKVTPVETDDKQLGMMLLSKTLTGDIEGTGTGRMLTAMSATEGSGAYVAVERITGKIQGKSGSLMLYHNGTMSGGKYQLQVKVVPDSGTDGLKGIAGEFKIEIKDGKHFYQLEYTLP